MRSFSNSSAVPGLSRLGIVVRCLLLLVVFAARADGYFSAKNVINGVERLIYDESFQTLPAGTGRVEILDGSTPLASGGLTKDGVFFLGTIYDPNPLSSSVMLTVRIWDSRYGNTYLEAKDTIGGSQSLTVPQRLSSGTEPPPPLDNFPTQVWLGKLGAFPNALGYFAASNQVNGEPRLLLSPGGTALAANAGRVELLVDGRVIASGGLVADGTFDLGYVQVPGHFAGEWVAVTVRAWDRTSGELYGLATLRASKTFQVGLGYNIESRPPPMNEFRSFALEESATPIPGTLSAVAPVGAQPNPILDRYGNPLPASVGMVELVWNGKVVQTGALSRDGQMDLGTLSIPGAAPGSVVELTVRAWDLSTGASYETALARGAVTFPVGPMGGEGNPPATLASMPQLRVTYPAPVIRSQAPSLITLATGVAASIPVQVEGLQLNFRWQFLTGKSNWVDLAAPSGIEGITNSILSFPALATTHRGTYRLRVWNSLTNVYSQPTRLEVQAPQALSILGSTSLRFGSDATLQVASTSLLPVSVTVASGPATVLRQTDAGIQIRPTGAGTLILHAVQSGSAQFQSAETNLVVPILPAGQTLTFDGPTDAIWSPDARLPLMATSSSGLPVAFRVVSGPARIEGTTLRLLDSGVGPVTVVAEQPGDANYEPAPPIVRSVLITKAIQSIRFDAIPDPADTDPALILNATSSSGLPVSFQVLSGPARVNANQRLELSGPGTVRIAAIQTGSATYQAASAVQSFTVIAAPRDIRLMRTAQGYQLLYRGEVGRLHRIESASTLGGAWTEVLSSSGNGLDRDTRVDLPSFEDSTRYFRVLIP